MKDYKIDKRLETLLPQHTAEQLEKLEEEIRLHKRCYSPLLLAQIEGEKVLVLYDGHTRVRLVQKLRKEGLKIEEPETEIHSFASWGEVVEAMLRVQNGRRNLTPADLAVAALKAGELIGLLRAKAKQNQKRGGKGLARAPKVEPIDTRKVAAKAAGVGQGTMGIVMRAAEIAPHLLERTLSSTPEEERLSIRQLSHRLALETRNIRRKEETTALKKRREEIEKTRPEKPSEFINQIITGNNRKVLADMEEGCGALVIGSPMYPLATIRYDNYRYENIATWRKELVETSRLAYRVLRKGGRVVWNIDDTNNYEAGEIEVLSVLTEVVNLMKEIGFLHMGTVGWFKQKTIGGTPNWGSTQSPSAPRFRRNWEYCTVFAKESLKLPGDDTLIDITRKEFEDFTIAHWYIPPAPRTRPKDKEWHPAPFPEELPYRFIKLLTRKNDLVIDPYNGSGTTTFVAKALGRTYTGIDLSPLYCGTARRRIQKLEKLSPEEQVKQIKRFQVPEGMRTDGYGKRPGGAK